MKLIHFNEPKHTERSISNQAKEVLKIKPDLILFEFPKERKSSLSYFNQFPPDKKPIEKIEKLKQGYKIASEKYPWLKREYKVIESIEKLWDEGKQVYLFEIDAPVELTNAGENSSNLLNFVWNYLRELYMSYNITKISKKSGEDKTALVLCHNFHWENIKFLLKIHTKHKIWDYYTKKYGIAKSLEEIQFELKKNNKTLYKYWKMIG